MAGVSRCALQMRFIMGTQGQGCRQRGGSGGTPEAKAWRHAGLQACTARQSAWGSTSWAAGTKQHRWHPSARQARAGSMSMGAQVRGLTQPLLHDGKEDAQGCADEHGPQRQLCSEGGSATSNPVRCCGAAGDPSLCRASLAAGPRLCWCQGSYLHGHCASSWRGSGSDKISRAASAFPAQGAWQTLSATAPPAAGAVLVQVAALA